MLLVVKVISRNFIFKRVPIAPSAGNVSTSTVSEHREKNVCIHKSLSEVYQAVRCRYNVM